MYITSIEPVKKGKVLVHLNNEPGFALYAKEAGEYGLKEDMELPPDLLIRIKELTLIPRCKSRLLHMLDRMDRTVEQVREKLREEYYPEDCIEEAIAAAIKGRYLDDRRYASQYAYEKSRSKSRRMIRAELKNKGLSDELIEEALEDTEDNEEELIRKQILKKKPDFENITWEEKQKLLSGICRKGFDADKVSRVYRELSQES